MRYAERKSNHIGKQRHAGVRQKEFPPHRKQLGMQNLLYSREVDFCIFSERMVALNQQGAQRQQ